MYQPHPGTAQLPEPQRPPAPAPVRTAVKVMYAGAAANLIYALVFIATLDSTEFALGRRSRGGSTRCSTMSWWSAAVVLLWRGPSSAFFPGRQS
jgi:hypothetical protein